MVRPEAGDTAQHDAGRQGALPVQIEQRVGHEPVVVAQAFVGNPPETSLILLKPLSPSGGGAGHTGGVFFQDKTDATPMVESFARLDAILAAGVLVA